jgi:Cu(I)-responsive transcriptional regulator
MPHDQLTIGDLARRTGVKVETIRYYERIGMLPAPGRTPGNYRAYDSAHLARLSFIRRARDLGFHLEQVRALLALSEDAQRPCAEVDQIASAHLREIDAKIADLKALRRELQEVVGHCRNGAAISECRIIDALGPRA